MCQWGGMLADNPARARQLPLSPLLLSVEQRGRDAVSHLGQMQDGNM